MDGYKPIAKGERSLQHSDKAQKISEIHKLKQIHKQFPHQGGTIARSLKLKGLASLVLIRNCIFFVSPWSMIMSKLMQLKILYLTRFQI